MTPKLQFQFYQEPPVRMVTTFWTACSSVENSNVTAIVPAASGKKEGYDSCRHFKNTYNNVCPLRSRVLVLHSSFGSYC